MTTFKDAVEIGCMFYSQVSQGSVATYVGQGANHDTWYIQNFFGNLAVNKVKVKQRLMSVRVVIKRSSVLFFRHKQLYDTDFMMEYWHYKKYS